MAGDIFSVMLALQLTRMHSSRMRTARLLPVSPSMHCSQGGTPDPRGCTWSRGVYLVGGGGTWPGTPSPVDRMTYTCKNITFANFVSGRKLSKVLKFICVSGNAQYKNVKNNRNAFTFSKLTTI